MRVFKRIRTGSWREIHSVYMRQLRFNRTFGVQADRSFLAADSLLFFCTIFLSTKTKSLGKISVLQSQSHARYCALQPHSITDPLNFHSESFWQISQVRNNFFPHVRHLTKIMSPFDFSFTTFDPQIGLTFFGYRGNFWHFGSP